jgi:hypothetical protein
MQPPSSSAPTAQSTCNGQQSPICSLHHLNIRHEQDDNGFSSTVQSPGPLMCHHPKMNCALTVSYIKNIGDSFAVTHLQLCYLLSEGFDFPISCPVLERCNRCCLHGATHCAENPCCARLPAIATSLPDSATAVTSPERVAVLCVGEIRQERSAGQCAQDSVLEQQPFQVAGADHL